MTAHTGTTKDIRESNLIIALNDILNANKTGQEQPAKEEKSLLAQLAPLAEKVRQAAAEKKAAKAEEALPAKTGKKKSR